MKRKSTHPSLLLFAGAMFLLALVVGSGEARAAGTVRLLTPSPQERANGSWTVRVKIELPKEPNIVIIPTRFTFYKNVYYERTITERGKPAVLNKLRIDPPRKNILSFDVKFSDTMGHVYNVTNFDFELKRANGFFEAGEYSFQLSNADGDLGGQMNITLNGENPEVDRSAIAFGPIEKVEKDGADAGAKPIDESPNTMQTGVKASGTGTPFIPSEAYNKTPDEELRDRPKGCGCAVPGLESNALTFGTPLASIAGLALVARFASARRRNRKRP